MLSAENVLVKRMARWIVFQPATMMAPFRQTCRYAQRSAFEGCLGKRAVLSLTTFA